MRGIYSIFKKVYLNHTTFFFHLPHHQIQLQLENRLFGLDEKFGAVGKEGLAVD
jgi:hypothetical protein